MRVAGSNPVFRSNCTRSGRCFNYFSTLQTPTWVTRDGVERVQPGHYGAFALSNIPPCRRECAVGTRKGELLEGPMVPGIVTEAPTAPLKVRGRVDAVAAMQNRRSVSGI